MQPSVRRRDWRLWPHTRESNQRLQAVRARNLILLFTAFVISGEIVVTS